MTSIQRWGTCEGIWISFSWRFLWEMFDIHWRKSWVVTGTVSCFFVKFLDKRPSCESNFQQRQKVSCLFRITLQSCAADRSIMTSFFRNFTKSVRRRFWRSPAMTEHSYELLCLIHLEVWSQQRGLGDKNCKLVGKRKSFTDCVTLSKLWIFRILLLGSFRVSERSFRHFATYR